MQIVWFLRAKEQKSVRAIRSLKRVNRFLHSFSKEWSEQIPLLLGARRANEELFTLLFQAEKGEKHDEKNEFEAYHS